MKTQMKSSWFPPLARDVTRLVLGTAVYTDASLDASVDLLDAWRDVGGNAIDTARRYGNAEAIIGRWLQKHRCRDEIILSTKGAHYDLETGRARVSPSEINCDLIRSIDDLDVDSIDVYWLHRDDATQPVGPILETLNEHLGEGRIRTFGASNWTERRLEEAAVYADERGLQTFTCSSPELSLACPATEPWPGCVTIHGQSSIDWYTQTQLPVFAWSSQAKGFFAGRRTEHVATVYDTPENRARLTRAHKLAREKGSKPVHVALAWVLQQPFPTYAIIGPEDVSELKDSVAALKVELTPEEVSWLDLRSA